MIVRILVIDVADGSVNMVLTSATFAPIALERLLPNGCIGRILADDETHPKLSNVILF